jgi:CPA2 family monovalent cation:H+ antiporter-2
VAVTPLDAGIGDTAPVYLQLGAVLFVLGVAARVAGRFGLPAVPLYLIAGLVLGAFDIPALHGDVLEVAAGLGVILLLFLIGLEHTAEELSANLRRFRRAGILDFALNFTAGFGFGLLLGWDPLAAMLLGGITWVTSSGIVVKALSDLRWRGPETPVILAVLVAEDLAMAVYLPLAASLLVGGGVLATFGSMTIAVTAALAAMVGAFRYGESLARVVSHSSEEVVLLSALGLVLMVAGLAEQLQVSAAVGAFLAGVALSGEVADRTRVLLAPIRDFNVSLFFLFFALQVDVGKLGSVALPALALALITGATKVVTGLRAARLAGLDEGESWRVALALLARGEMSLVLAGLGASAAIEPRLAPLAAAYVMLLAIGGPVAMRFADDLVPRLARVRPRVATPAA